MPKWKLFVDDERVGPQGPCLKDENGEFIKTKDGKYCHEWTDAPNYEEAIELIKSNGIPVDMSLDHDIWTGVMQGDEFVEWLEMYVNQGHPLPKDFEYSIHSSNESGAKNMHTIMQRFVGKPATYMTQWWN